MHEAITCKMATPATPTKIIKLSEETLQKKGSKEESINSYQDNSQNYQSLVKEIQNNHLLQSSNRKNSKRLNRINQKIFLQI